MSGPRTKPEQQESDEKRRLDAALEEGWRRPFRHRTRSMSPSRRPRKPTITSGGRIKGRTPTGGGGGKTSDNKVLAVFPGMSAVMIHHIF
jgi:hypothetical protein